MLFEFPVSGVETSLWLPPLVAFVLSFFSSMAVVAGATLAGTFATSVIGIAVYSMLPVPGGGGAAPDWLLGSLFGLGGLVGMYAGAATQKHMPQALLRLGLGLLLGALGAWYLWPGGV